MGLPDLLQWLGNTRQTGTLLIERDKVSKSILLRDGQVVGCSSDDPPERLGHFLLARGKISEEQLREALDLQELSGKHLGMMLVEMGALTADELSSDLEAKADETIYSLFEWNEAVFRFTEEITDQANLFPVSLRVEDVLLRGLKRFDEVQRIREVFNDPGIVLNRTDRQPPGDLIENQTARTIYESINGDRTVAEILLHVHGSEYAVTKFLFELQQAGYVQISGAKQVAPATTASAPPAGSGIGEGAPLKAPPVPGPSPTPVGSASSTVVAETPHESEVDSWLESWDPCVDQAEDSVPRAPTPVAAEPVFESPTPASTETAPSTQTEILTETRPEAETGAEEDEEQPDASAGTVELLEKSPTHILGKQLERARARLKDGEFEASLDILDDLYRQFPGDDSLRRLTAEAEAAFVEKAYKYFLPPSKIPVLTQPMERLESENISPTEFFLLSRMDGTWNIKAIIQIAPLRESDALRTLKRMRETGLIDLQDA